MSTTNLPPVLSFPPEFLYQQAVQAFERQNWLLAESRLRQLLAVEPDHADALHYLGMTLHQQGQSEQGIALMQQGLAIHGDHAAAYNNLGTVYAGLQRYDEAAAAFEQAIELWPEYVDAHYNLARVLAEQEEYEDALWYFRKALALEPEHVKARWGMALSNFRMARYGEAVWELLQLLERQPRNSEALGYLAMAAHELGSTAVAERTIRQAIELDPEVADYHKIEATIFSAQKRYAEVVECCKKMAQIQPEDVETRRLLGVAYTEAGQLKESEHEFREAIKLAPDYADLYACLGFSLYVMGHAEEAVANCRCAIELQPDHLAAYGNMLYLMQNLDESRETVFQYHLQFAQRFETPLKARWPVHRNACQPGRRLKIGYVSPDFCAHSLAAFIRPVLESHDKTRFEIYGYYNDVRPSDTTTQLLKSFCDHWIECAQLSDEALAHQIHDKDQIDILVDLAGHTAHNRLMVFARKPAPIQMTWIGNLGTTGLSAVDYRLTDANLDPPGLSEAYHSEQLIRLPLAHPFDFREDGYPAVAPLPALSGAPFTFVCFNRISKFTAANVALWSKILHRLPDARMLFGNTEDEVARKRLLTYFADNGIDESRLILHKRMGTARYLAMHNEVDLALDTFPYNGGTTTEYSLWMGVPVVTLAGDRPVARCGACNLIGAGLPELIAETEAEYVELAVQYASDLPALNQIRLTLRDRIRANPNNDPVTYTRQLEQTYQKLWDEWCAKNKTRPTFTIQARSAT